MKKLIGLEGGTNETWFKVLGIKEATIKIYPSIKDGKVMSALETGFFEDFWKYKKEVVVPGYYAIVAGNAVCAAEGIKDALGRLEPKDGEYIDGDYKAIAVNPTCVEIYAAADFDEQVRRICDAG